MNSCLLAIADSIYCCSDDSLFKIIDNDVIQVCPVENPIGILCLEQGLLVATAAGDLLVLDDDLLDNVGTFDSGILAISSSPDAELFVIVTGDGKMVEMTKDFEVVMDTQISIQDQGIDSQVALGWGKKETQFHGKAGKEAAKVKDEPVKKSLFDDGKPRISWRGDGNYFAISCLENQGEEHRVLRIYNREGILLNTSINVPGLEHPLSWRPSGNLIASTQLLPHRQDVVFFERNGLRHGEFTLRDKCTVLELEWNSDSSILAIWMKKENGKKVIQLWTSKNYYWYLKQEIVDDFISLKWDPEFPFRLHTVNSHGDYQQYNFISLVLTSTCKDPSFNSVVAVVDGCDLLLTPLKIRNVPPPMSFSKSVHSNPITAVAFAKHKIHDIAVLLSDQTVDFITDTDKESCKKVASLNISDSDARIRQLIWPSENTLVLLQNNSKSRKDEIIVLKFELGTLVVVSRKQVNLANDTPIIRLIHNIEEKVLAFETIVGEIYEIVEQGGSHCCVERARFPTVCPWIDCVRLGSSKSLEWIGLNERNKLFIGQRLLASDCISFFIHNEFLITSTLSHNARFLSLQLEEYNFSFKERDALSKGFDEKLRRVEEGSKIILATPGDVNLILQMPRGNLETISPRALVLSRVRKAIDMLDYKSAFMTCRRHRIDLNLLIDHNFAQFENHIDDVIKQIENPEYLNLIIANLRDENVLETMYPDDFQKPKAVEQKTNKICTTFQRSLEKIDEQYYIQSILTTDAKQNPPALESSMRRIYQIRENISADAAESALQYLIFLVDVDKLYNVALGMYDFPLVLMVAQHSQKDPREYVPFLTELAKLEKYYQRFRIDDHLGKKAQALRHLSLAVFEASGDYENAIQNFALAGCWKQAVSISISKSWDSEKLNDCLKSALDVLEQDRRFYDLSRIYAELLKDTPTAIQMLLKGSFWNDAILMAQQTKHGHLIESDILPFINNFSKELLSELKEMDITFDRQRLRLIQVLAEKKENLERLKTIGDDEQLKDVELLSDTASMATTVTGSIASSRMSNVSTRTGRTSKQRKKMARKRAAGKDAAFEDEFLRTEIKKSIIRTNIITKEITELLTSLVRFNNYKLAVELQATLKKLIANMKTNFSSVFDNQESLLQRNPEDPEPPSFKVIQPPEFSQDIWWLTILG